MPTLMAPTEANTLAARRKELGMTQTDVANACGTTQKTVSYWERGKHLPTKLGHRQQYAAALQWDIGQVDESIQLTARLAGTDIPGQLRRLATNALNVTGCRTSVPYPSPTLVAA